MKRLMVKNKKKRDFYSKIEVKVRILKYIILCPKFLFKWRVQACWLLFNLLHKKSYTAIELRCKITYRSRSVLYQHGISRHLFKLSAQQGLLMSALRHYK